MNLLTEIIGVLEVSRLLQGINETFGRRHVDKARIPVAYKCLIKYDLFFKHMYEHANARVKIK